MFPAMLRVASIGTGNKDIRIPDTGLMFLRKETLRIAFRNTNNKQKINNMETNNMPVAVLILIGVFLSMFIKW